MEQENRFSLIQKHIGFAKRLARRFYTDRLIFGIEQEEFEAAAMLGLCEAAWRFDPGRGQQFETFSYYRIKGAMLDLVRRGGWNVRGCAVSVLEPNVESEEPSDEAACGDDSEHYYTVLRSANELASVLNAIEDVGIALSIKQGGVDAEVLDITYANSPTPESSTLARNLRYFLECILEELPRLEREVIRLYYFEDHTLEGMRSYFNGASKSWLSRIHRRALKNLRTQLIKRDQICIRRLEEQAVYAS